MNPFEKIASRFKNPFKRDSVSRTEFSQAIQRERELFETEKHDLIENFETEKRNLNENFKTERKKLIETSEAKRRNLIEKLETRIEYYQDRTVMAKKNADAIESELQKQEDRFLSEDLLIRTRIALERAKAKVNRLMGCWFELKWFCYLLKFGNSEKWLDFHFLEFADFEHMLNLGKEGEEVEES